MSKKTHQKSNGIRNRFKCNRCGKGYSFQHYLDNHKKHCGGENE